MDRPDYGVGFGRHRRPTFAKLNDHLGDRLLRLGLDFHEKVSVNQSVEIEQAKDAIM
jgi:hypothetical protein